MTVYSNIYQLSGTGTFNRIDLATSGFQFQADSFLVGATSPVLFNQTSAGNLLTLTGGTDIAGTLHNHNTLYFTKTQLGQATIPAGTTLIGDNNSYTNFTPASATLKAALTAIDTALSGVGGVTFQDTTFRIYDDGDPTKRIAFQASGIATSTTRTITVPNADVDLGNLTNNNISASAAIDYTKLAALTASRALVSNPSGFISISATTSAQVGYLSTTTSDVQVQIDGKVSKTGDTMSGALAMGNNKITGLANGTNANDAINLSQLQSAQAGVDFQPDVNDVVANATTTAPGTGLPAASAGQRYILQSGTGSLNVAWGTITGVGNNDIVQYDGTNWIVAYDVSVKGAGALVWSTAGVSFYSYDGTAWGTFGGLAGVTAGTGLSKSGNTLNVNLGAGIVELPSDEVGVDTYSAGGLFLTVDGTTPSTATAAQLSVFLDGATLARSSSGLKISTGGVSATELATDAVTTVKILNSNVTLAKLAAQSVDDSKLVNTSNVYKSSTKTMLTAEDTNHYHQSVQYDSITAGESFAAGAVYFGYMADAAGSARLFKATNDRSGGDKFDAFLAVKMTTTVATAGAISESNADHIYVGGIITFPSTPFATGDVGKAVYLGTAGSFTLTPPAVETTTGLALVKLGNVISVSKMSFRPQVIAVS